MDIYITEENDFERYNKILIEQRGSPFISPLFVKSLISKKSKPICLKIISNSNTIGLISGLVIESSFLVTRKLGIFRSLLFYSGPSLIKYDKLLINKCIANLIEYAKKKFCVIKFRPYDYPHEFYLDNDNFQIKKHEEFILNLNPSWEEIKHRMNSNIKSKINKSKRFDLKFEISKSKNDLMILTEHLDDVKKFRESRGYSHFIKYYLPYLNENGMQCLLNSNLGKLFLIKENDDVLSVQLNIIVGERAYAIFLGTNPKGYKVGANAYIFYKGMEYLKSIGVKYFNIGGYTAEGKEGMIFFKSGLGADRFVCFGGESELLQGKFNKKLLGYYNKGRRIIH